MVVETLHCNVSTANNQSNINILNKKIMFKSISNPALNGFSKGDKNEFTNTENEQKQWEIFRVNYWHPSA